MRTLFNNPALFKYDDTIRIPYRRKTMGNDKSSTTFHQGIHTVLRGPSFRAAASDLCTVLHDGAGEPYLLVTT